MEGKGSFIASLDVGTTSLRCFIINEKGEVIGKSSRMVKLLYPQPGFVEIDPDTLWEDVITVIKAAISDAQLMAKDIRCIGISTQRSTFINWLKDTGKPLHNFITWKDLRANQLVKQLNSSPLLIVFRYLAYSLYTVTRNKRYLSGSRLNLASNHVTVRLLWALNNIPNLKTAVQNDNVRFGTLETWLLYKLTGGKTYVTDISNASATGFYDPFVLDWGTWAFQILNIPAKILPTVVANDFEFGTTEEKIFGASIPIKCVMSDQSSSMFGLGCLNCNDLKVTLGTGGFLNLNTANKITPTSTGMYPLVGWKLNADVVFLSEIPCNDVGSVIQWSLRFGFFKDPQNISELIQDVKDTDGIFFIPAFSGLGPPVDDERAASGFVGIKPTSRKEHVVRSIMEGITFRLCLAYLTLNKELPRNYTAISVDGGVSKNDFICQLFADITNLKVKRLKSSEMSSMGVGFLAGFKSGIWKDLSDLDSLRKVDVIFYPTEDDKYKKKLKLKLDRWLNAANRLRSWYSDENETELIS